MVNKRIMLLLVSFISFVSVVGAQTPMDVSPPASIDLPAPGGQTRTIPINITNNSNTVDEYGLKLTYPTSLLTFQKTDSTGTLTQGWESSTGQENIAGEVIIGGFTNGAGFTGNGVLINVIFVDTAVPGTGQVALSNFLDDISNATTTNGTINSSVPVELVSFSAQFGTGEVTLSWTTASEENNYGFDIEKSLDGETFSQIGFVRGQGTTTVPQRYAFSDTKLDPEQPIRYYRLKQIDLDGAFTYSSVLEVNLTAPESFTLRQNYPNPFNPETTITYELPEATKVTLVVYNTKGELVRTLLDEVRPAGVHNVVWNGRDDLERQVASGMYLYQMRAGDVTHVRMLTLLR